MLSITLSYTFCLVLVLRGISAATPNADDKFQKWQTPGRILFQLAADFDVNDYQVLQRAMEQLAVDSGQCIKFQRYDSQADKGKDFLYISSKLATKSMATCFTFPGRNVENQGRGQYMVMFSSRTAPVVSPTGTYSGACLDTVRDAMKYLYQALGFRSEYGRTDRVNYIDFVDPTQPNLGVSTILMEYGPFKMYLPGEASFYNLFDPLSITMVDGKKWAKSAMNPVFTPKQNVVLGGKSNLSQQDCQALAMYNCDTMKCQNPYLLTNTGTLSISPVNNPLQANGVCAVGQSIVLGSVMASGLQTAAPVNDFQSAASVSQGNSVSGSAIAQGTVISGMPSNGNSFGPSEPSGLNAFGIPTATRAVNSPYTFSIVGSNPYNFQVLPDSVNPSKANIIMVSAVRSFTNAQVTVQVASVANPSQLAQTLVTVDLNCAPVFPKFPTTSASGSLTRITYPDSPIKGVACDGNMLTNPVIIGAFTAVDPDNEPITYYLTTSKKFQISSAGTLVLIEAPTPNVSGVASATAPLEVNAMDANGAVAILRLSVAFNCQS